MTTAMVAAIATALRARADSPSASADYTTQTLQMVDRHGQSWPFTLSDLNAYAGENISLGLVYGAQIGLASLMLVTLLLLTQPGKRGSPIYMLNLVSLIFDLLRGTMMAVWLGSTWNAPYVYFTGDVSPLSRLDVSNSVAATVFKLLELGAVLFSLVFQVRVIMSTAKSSQRGLVVGLAALMAFSTIAVQLANTIVNAQTIASFAAPGPGSLQQRLANAAGIMQTVAVAFFLIIFAGKLGVAIRQRRRLGHSKFGPMQMVFIGSVQTMIIPMIFTAAQYNRQVDLGSLSLTVLVIQLPLTALWASASLEDRAAGQAVAPRHPNRHIAMPGSERTFRSGSEGKGKLLSADTDTDGPISPMKSESGSAYRMTKLPLTTTLGSLDVDIKIHERDMV